MLSRHRIAAVAAPTAVVAGLLSLTVATSSIGAPNTDDGSPLPLIPAPTTVATSTTTTSSTTTSATTIAPPAAPGPIGVAEVGVAAVRRPSEEITVATAVESMPVAPTSPDVGDHCAERLDASGLSEFWAEPVGPFGGADYQRATRLPDDRVLWTFQDAFVAGRLVHNVGFVQSGRCFTMLGPGDRSWLLADETVNLHRWHWILDVAVGAGGTELHAFVVEMNETGPGYLSRTRPVALRRVVLDASTFEVRRVVDEPMPGGDLYGWSITSDDAFTYLYSHCYQQFGYETTLGFGPCVADVRLARVPLGRLDEPREFWTGAGWSPDAASAVPVVDGSFVFSGNNPAQITRMGERFLLVEKRDDWWGSSVEFGISDRPEGPFEHVGSVPEPLGCDGSLCNSYFAAWVPWVDDAGSPIWSIGHNRWNGSETSTHLADYRPTFHRAPW